MLLDSNNYLTLPNNNTVVVSILILAVLDCVEYIAFVHFLLALCEYGAALEGYMEAAALSTSHFHDLVPGEVWSANILRRLINCCQRLNYHTQAAILCQLLQPVDYDLAFRILRENATSLLENMFAYFWDMTIIEYLICILHMKALTLSYCLYSSMRTYHPLSSL